MDASDPDPGPQERELNCRPAVGSESCGPMIIVFKGRELLLLLLLRGFINNDKASVLLTTQIALLLTT